MRAFRLLLVSLATFGALASLPACKTARTPTPTVTIDTGERKVPFKVELAITPSEQERGLMYREHLDPDAGMLFISDSPRHHVFWMKNTLIPLDMVFIRADGTIARIATAPPLDETPVPAGEPIAGVLELAGGRAAQLGIRAGDRVSW